MRIVSKFVISFFLFCGLVLSAPLYLSAQDWRAWTPEGRPAELAFIYYAQGRDFSHTIRGQQTIFSAEVIRRGSVILDRSGVVQTGSGTSLEIQLVPCGTLIKLSENTTIIYNGIDQNGGFADIGLLFGRIRVVSGVADPGGIHPIVVRSGGIAARIIDGDMGIDYVLEPGRNIVVSPMFRVHAFRGSAEVYFQGAGVTAAPLTQTQVFAVEQGGSLSLDVTPAHTFVERGALGSSVIAYWSTNNFAGTPPLRMPNTAIALALEPIPQELVREVVVEVLVPVIQPMPVEQAPQMSLWARRLLWGMGLSMIGSAVAIQGIAHYNPDFFGSANRAENMHTFSYGPLISGVLFTLLGTWRNIAVPAR